MIVIGHRFVNFQPFYRISSAKDIKNTPSGSTVLFDFSEKNIGLAKHCKKNGVSFATEAKDIKDIIFSNTLGANYILVQKNLEKTAQKIAENYLFDAKILLKSTNEEDIEQAAKDGIDGIILKEGIAG